MLLGEVQTRVKDEIPSEQTYFGTRYYQSFETSLGENDEGFEYNYLRVDANIKTPLIRTPATDKLLVKQAFYLSPNKLEIRRITYGIFSVFADLGGLLNIMEVTAAVIVSPLSEFLFFLFMTKRLYFAGTDVDGLFGEHERKRNEANREKYLDVN